MIINTASHNKPYVALILSPFVTLRTSHTPAHGHRRQPQPADIPCLYTHEPDGDAPCEYGEDGAIAAGRLRDFVTVYVNENDEHGVTLDICEAQSSGNMSSALEDAMDLIEVACDDYVVE